MLKFFKHNPTRINLQKYQQAWAKACYIIKIAKKETWRNYISKLNNKTPINKTWEIIGKISGKKRWTTITYLNTPNGGKSIDKKEIANQIAAEFSQNSSLSHYSPKFQKYKNIAEKKKLNFTSNNRENYSSSFSITEVKNSINKGKKHSYWLRWNPPYQFLKHLPETFLIILLQIFNDMWWSNNFPNTNLRLLSSQSPTQEKITLTQQTMPHCLNKLHL